MAADAAGTRVNLARDKEGQQRRNNDLVERNVPPELIVFVTAKSRPCEMIDVVFEEGDIVLQPKRRRGL